jgi:hypothetical protein
LSIWTASNWQGKHSLSRNSLARAVFIHRLGEIRDCTYESQQHRASVNLTGDYVWAAEQEVSENNDGISPLRARDRVGLHQEQSTHRWPSASLTRFAPEPASTEC